MKDHELPIITHLHKKIIDLVNKINLSLIEQQQIYIKNGYNIEYLPNFKALEKGFKELKIKIDEHKISIIYFNYNIGIIEFYRDVLNISKNSSYYIKHPNMPIEKEIPCKTNVDFFEFLMNIIDSDQEQLYLLEQTLLLING